MSLPLWDQLTFTFGWEPWVQTMRQCTALAIEFSTDVAPGVVANPAPAAPYTVIIYAGGYRPLTMAAGNIGVNGTFHWVVNLPVGPQYILGMKDSAGYNGGSSLLWTMSTGNGSCPLDPSPITPSSLSFTRTGSAQCGEINYVMHNGKSPYQIEIIPEIHQSKTLYFATNKFGFIMDLPTGLKVYIAIRDADGNSGVDELMTVGSSNDNSCLKAAGTVSVGMASTMYTGSGVSMPSATPTSFLASTTTNPGSIASTGLPQSDSDEPTGIKKNVPIIAGVVTGAVAIAFIIFLLFCIHRRRKRRIASQAQSASMIQQHVNLPQNPPTYFGPPVTQYPSLAVPQIQTPEPHMYAPAPYAVNHGHFAPTPPSDAYNPYFANMPTHTPRPRSYHTGHTPLLDGSPSNQSPHTLHFSQGTPSGSGDAPTTTSRPSTGTGTPPGLPHGALAPLSNLGQSGPQWVLQAPGTPPVRSLFGSPRSETLTLTTLPPYGPAGEKPQSPALEE
ncbi:unnamed protein product [Rhizoctonia solani]|uniref:Uncharacterized protein n=1 Tax=Rhizoctonia solani TaxID=456999 RepID=A0A8H3DH42_9AGAM|nr:unnamed protein product [Rhizoctonia solani]